MSAVALKVDIISINEFDSSICRPLVDKHMFRHVPALGTELKNCENVRTVVLGNVNISGNAERPNHFILLGVVESRIEPYDKHCTYTENVRIGEQVKAVVDMVGEQPIDIYCERESAIDVDAIDATGHIFLQTDDKCDVSIVKQDGTGLDVRIGNEGTFSLVRSRSVQQVVTNAQRLTVAKWMIEKENEGVENIPTKAVEEFPRFFFRQSNADSNKKKSKRWFAKRHELVQTTKQHFITSTFHGGSRKKCGLKTVGGRGRKRADWVEWLHGELLTEFERLSSMGVKFSYDLLRLLAQGILDESKHDTFNTKYIDPKDKKQQTLGTKITRAWVTIFTQWFDIVQRKQSGKLLVSNEKQLSIEKNVAYHLQQVKRDFDDGILDENMVENSDETHFAINMDNKKTLALKGSDNVKYADVVGGGDGMTLMVRVTGGVDAKIYASLMIFSNKDRSYPIRGLVDDVPGVCYRTGSKGWMDHQVFVQWLEEKRANPPDKYGRRKVIFMDNCSGHNDTNESVAALAKLNAEIRKLPANATDLCQPADSFIISKIKDVWRREWERKKIDMIKDGLWSNEIRGDGQWSGKLKNPGKRYFLKLAAQAVAEVNEQRDELGMSYARKAMIKCGLSKDAVTGKWQESQLFDHLQVIINKHREYFDGKVPE